MLSIRVFRIENPGEIQGPGTTRLLIWNECLLLAVVSIDRRNTLS